jgi:hypothetical protein
VGTGVVRAEFLRRPGCCLPPRSRCSHRLALSYGDLAIQEGNTASLEFLRVHYGDVSEEERQRIRRQLETYCGRDTEGMVWIVGALKDLVA